jgi:hypothetical protein
LRPPAAPIEGPQRSRDQLDLVLRLGTRIKSVVSIFGSTGQVPQFHSLPARLDLFADRHELARLFLSKLHASAEPPAQVLFLHGMGGAGKSLLLRYLQARCCVRFRDGAWRELSTQPFPAILQHLRSSGRDEHVPNALIDFGAEPIGLQRPLEALPGLFILKQQLHVSGISTPRLDFAALSYLQKSGLDYDKILPELFPKGEVALARTVIDFLAGLPLLSAGKAAYDALETRTHHATKIWWMTRAVEQQHVAEVLQAPADPDLADLLPYYLALDLNAALQTGSWPGIVLFFDTHEAFWGSPARSVGEVTLPRGSAAVVV